MKVKRQLLSLLLCAAMLFALCPQMVLAAISIGSLISSEDGVTYDLSDIDKDGINDMITFSGSGEITKQVLSSFFLSVSDPQYEDRSKIKYIVIGDGITGTVKDINGYNSVFTNAKLR